MTDAELEAAIAECEAYLRRYIGGPKRIAVMDRLSMLREIKELRAFVRELLTAAQRQEETNGR